VRSLCFKPLGSESIARQCYALKQPIAVSTPIKAPAVVGTAGAFISSSFGRVAAGRPIEALDHDELRMFHPLCRMQQELHLEGEGKLHDRRWIFDGDVHYRQEQNSVRQWRICVCMVERGNVKRYYLHQGARLARLRWNLRPANADLEHVV